MSVLPLRRNVVLCHSATFGDVTLSLRLHDVITSHSNRTANELAIAFKSEHVLDMPREDSPEIQSQKTRDGPGVYPDGLQVDVGEGCMDCYRKLAIELYIEVLLAIHAEIEHGQTSVE